MRFLLVEDNADLARALSGRFAVDGHVVDHAASLADAELATRTVSYDLILLDIMLPDGDGREFLRRHRAQDAPTPVIVLTARSEVSDRVGLLDLGADDYITKPFDFAELEARTRAVMRRLGGAADNKKEFAELIFDSNAGTISAGGRAEQLRNREMRLLEVFFAAPGQIFSKSHLMDRLFSFADDVSENAIEVYVGRLRRKLSETQATIETVRGLGYRMVRRE
ncbi:response regulator transcription factor [Roseobacter sinensis]|uniref:Response regulator transcription factor n=1 Tax=Roseobacter sinensis TaxID=2931391 RepID=A0ABT3BD96_9RHOB|nr:response regulator transcription factor [Roseobacter sp. WL0113]MCV3271548.1 response regulator transcription factor [Roseobacter sp. WL0113]